VINDSSELLKETPQSNIGQEEMLMGPNEISEELHILNKLALSSLPSS
jgi:hypothetical protein